MSGCVHRDDSACSVCRQLADATKANEGLEDALLRWRDWADMNGAHGFADDAGKRHWLGTDNGRRGAALRTILDMCEGLIRTGTATDTAVGYARDIAAEALGPAPQ